MIKLSCFRTERKGRNTDLLVKEFVVTRCKCKVILLTIFVNPKPKWPHGRVFRLTVDMVYHLSLHCLCKTLLNINGRVLFYIEMVRIKGDKSILILPSLCVIKRDNNRGRGEGLWKTTQVKRQRILVISTGNIPHPQSEQVHVWMSSIVWHISCSDFTTSLVASLLVKTLEL